MLRIYLDNCCYNRPFDPPSNPTIIFESSAKMLIQTLIVNQMVELVNPVDFIRIWEDEENA